MKIFGAFLMAAVTTATLPSTEIIPQLVVPKVAMATFTPAQSSLSITSEGNILENFLDYLKDNLLEFDDEILEELEEMMSVCTFRAPDGKKCGELLVEILKHLFFGKSKHHDLAMQAKGNILANFLDYLKDNLLEFDEEILHELEEMMKVCTFRAPDGKRCGQLLVEILKHLFLGKSADQHGLTVQNKGNIIESFLDYLKDNLLEFDEEILDEMEQMMSVCTFKAPDGKKCGELLLQILKHLIFGTEHNLAVEAHSSFIGGVMRALVGDSQNFHACQANLGAVMHRASHLISSLRHRNFEDVLEDIELILGYLVDTLKHRHVVDKSDDTDFKGGSCLAAVRDLEPLLNIFKGVRTPAGVVSNLKENFLETDADIVDRTAAMSKYCSFKEPNAGKCGFNLGSIVRDILAGTEDAIVV